MDNFHDLFFDLNTFGTQNQRDQPAFVPAPPNRIDNIRLTQAFQPSSTPPTLLQSQQDLFEDEEELGTTVHDELPPPSRKPPFLRDKNAVIGIVQPTPFERTGPSEVNRRIYARDIESTPLGPTDTPRCLNIPRKTPGGSASGVLKLRPVAEIPDDFQSVFPFPYFNAVQSKAFDDLLYTDRPVVMCAPTGSGKTVLFELAIIRLLMSHSGIVSSNCKIVYMAPVKALCSERFTDWQNKFNPLGLKCMELTGDTELDDYFELQAVNIIFTTPEKWDSMTRRWRDNKSFVRMVRLYLIDEVHMLNDSSRGATMEAVVSRMKTVNVVFKAENPALENQMKTHIRFVAVSATIPNAEDVGAWLGTDKLKAACHRLDDSHRPVRLRKVVLGFPCSDNQSEFRFDLSLNYKLAGIIETYSEQKPSLVFCATRKGAQQAAATLVKDARFVMTSQHKARLMHLANGLRETKLREVVVHGVAYHHAGLDLQDRRAVEGLFTAGDLPVLISTSTLAMGVNLPAHLVVIKSTQHYVMGSYEEYSETAILQMIGRAGRPQFDTSATAVIMTRTSTKSRYECLVNGAQLIESSLHQNLMEHLNAEVVLATINDVSVALEWLKSTFLYIRIMKNPKYYGLSTGMSVDVIEQKLQELCLENLNALAEVKLIHMEEDAFGLKPTETGRLMARYCIAFETMKKLQGVCGEEEIGDLLTILCNSKEFKDIQLRNNEKRTLNTLNKDKNRTTIRYPMEGKIKTNEMKVNCLIQATLGCLPVQDFALSSDTNKILRSVTRISKCLVEILWHQPHYKALLSAVILGKCVRARLWENSKHISRQLPGIGDKLANMLVNSGLSSFQKLEDTNPREIELIVNRHPPFGNQVRDSAMHLPKYELYIDQLSNYSEHCAEITISVTMINATSVTHKSTAGPNHTCVLLIGNSDNQVVFKARVSDAVLMKGGSWSRKIEIRRAKNSEELSVNFISQDYVGLDVHSTYTPFYIGPKRVTSSPKDQKSYQATESLSNSKMAEQQNKPGRYSAVVRPLEAGRRQCSHHCIDKATCAHDCCKNGVAVRTKSTALDNYRRELKQRASSMPETPNVKRLKPDMSRFKYTPASLPQVTHTPRVDIKSASNDWGTGSRSPSSDMPHQFSDDWGDIELHRQKASAATGWNIEDIVDEDLLLLQTDENSFSRNDVYPNYTRLPFMCDDEFTVEDFQTFGVSDDEHYLPDILPPENKYGHEPNPRDSRLNLPPYKSMTKLPGKGNVTTLKERSQLSASSYRILSESSNTKPVKQTDEGRSSQNKFIPKYNFSDSDSDFESLMVGSSNFEDTTIPCPRQTCQAVGVKKKDMSLTIEPLHIAKNISSDHKPTISIHPNTNLQYGDTGTAGGVSSHESTERISFSLGEWENDDLDLQEVFNTTTMERQNLKQLEMNDPPRHHCFWDNIFSQPTPRDVTNKRSDGAEMGNQDFHNDIFAGIF